MADQAPTPESPPETSPNGEAASSPDSSTAPSSRRAASLFIGDPGPAFDERHAADQPALPVAEPVVELPGWEEDTVRGILVAEGAGVHTVFGVAEDDWLWLEHELDAMVGPLTRILNRYPATRAAAGTGDEVAVVIALGGHISRSYLTRKAELAVAQAQDQPEPVTGARAPEGTGADASAVGAGGGWQVSG